MNNDIISSSDVKIWLQSDEVLKLTSLLYLKEALGAQRYEDCAGLITQAKGFGAKQSEISALIAEVFRSRSSRSDAGYGAKLKNKNRLQ